MRRNLPFFLMTCLSAALLTYYFFIEDSLGQTQAIITVDPNITYQTMTGWEALTYAADWPGHSVAFPDYMDTLNDLAVNDLGINRVRLSITSGIENTTDFWIQWQNGQITREGEYMQHRFEIINDNASPSSINASGFQFGFVDHQVDYMVNPMRQLLAARGEQLYVNLTYVGQSRVADEYAEFMLATFQHLQGKYGWVPDAIEVVLEPDERSSNWTAMQMADVIVATGDRLQANGFTPDFIAPSALSMVNSIGWFDQIVGVSGTQNYITELSYHRYGGVSDSNIQAVANRAEQYNIDASMIEFLGAQYQQLHKDLKLGRNSAWNGGYSLMGRNPNVDYFHIDDSNPSAPIVVMNQHTKFYRQYFKFIRAGAVRVEATTNDNHFDPVAFVNEDGTYVVVILAHSAGSFSIAGLPASTYGMKYTTLAEYDVDLPDVSLAPGQALSGSMARDGVITIYSKTPAAPTAPSSVTIDGPASIPHDANIEYAATVNPANTTSPITYTWEATMHTPVTNVGSTNDTVAFSWGITGTVTIDVTATNALGSVSATKVIEVGPNHPLYLPTVVDNQNRSYSLTTPVCLP